MKIISKWQLRAKDLAEYGIFDRYDLHQKLCNIFDESTIRFSLNSDSNSFTIIIISNNEAINIPTIGNIQSKPFEIVINNDEIFKVKCDLNAVIQSSTIEHPNPRKTSLVGFKQISNWLRARHEKIGCSIENLIVGPTQHDYIAKKNHNIAWHKITFNANVENSELFKNIVMNGLGSSKYCGLGLVSIFRQ